MYPLDLPFATPSLPGLAVQAGPVASANSVGVTGAAGALPGFDDVLTALMHGAASVSPKAALKANGGRVLPDAAIQTGNPLPLAEEEPETGPPGGLATAGQSADPSAELETGSPPALPDDNVMTAFVTDFTLPPMVAANPGHPADFRPDVPQGALLRAAVVPQGPQIDPLLPNQPEPPTARSEPASVPVSAPAQTALAAPPALLAAAAELPADVAAPGRDSATAPPTAPVPAAAPAPAAAPSSSAASALPGTQLERLVDALVQAREAGKGARGDIAVRHGEFGMIAIRLEQDGSETRAHVTGRDPGFAPAIVAALAERSSAGFADHGQRGQDQRSQDQGWGQQGAAHSDPRQHERRQPSAENARAMNTADLADLGSSEPEPPVPAEPHTRFA